MFPNWNGTTQERRFSFRDDGRVLELTTPPTDFGGVGLIAAVIWQRAGQL